MVRRFVIVIGNPLRLVALASQQRHLFSQIAEYTVLTAIIKLVFKFNGIDIINFLV